MPYPLHRKITGFKLLLLALAWPLAAQATAQLAIDMGCYSCHGAYLRDEAPSIERLAERLASYKGDSSAQQKFVEKFGAGEMFGHIAAHERLSPASARTLVQWLAEGAK